LAHLDIPKEKTASTVGFFACAFAGIFVLLYDIENHVNAGMPEKDSPASAFLPVVSCLSPASAFRHQGSVRYR
jgi:hypothetical protein